MMKKRSFALFLALVLCAGALPVQAFSFPFNFGQGEKVTIPKAEYERLKQYEKLDEVKKTIEEYYYQDVDDTALIDGAIQGLLSGTDDVYTFYYPEESWKRMWEDDEGKYAGIGIQMLGDYQTNLVTVTRVFKGTPAEASGIQKGDILYMVEELEVTVATMQDAVDTMRGVPGESVNVQMLRSGEVISFDIIKAEIIVNRVESKMLDSSVGYIAHYEFAGDSFEDFKKAFDELEADGMKALIIDLRDNGGGWVNDGVELADLFLDRVLLFYTEGKIGREDSYSKDGKSDIPLVLLVNEHSASTSEIVAGALQDYERATLVGTTTFGKGVIQAVLGLSDGKTGYQFTTAQYFTPTGRQVHEHGITPDIEVEMPEDMDHSKMTLGDMTDPQLLTAWQEALKLAE
jgi:carboxyl-terminal processing protease